MTNGVSGSEPQLRQFTSAYIRRFRCTEPGIPASHSTVFLAEAARINREIYTIETQMRKAIDDLDFEINEENRDELVEQRDEMMRRHIAESRTRFPKPLTRELTTNVNGGRYPRFKEANIPILRDAKDTNVLQWLDKIIRACTNFHPEAFSDALVNFSEGDIAAVIKSWYRNGKTNAEVIGLIERHYGNACNVQEARARLRTIKRKPDEKAVTLAERIMELVRIISREQQSRGFNMDEQQLAIEAFREALGDKVKNIVSERHRNATVTVAAKDWDFEQWTEEAQNVLDEIEESAKDKSLKKYQANALEEYKAAQGIKQVAVSPPAPPMYPQVEQPQTPPEAHPVYRVSPYGYATQWAGHHGAAAGHVMPPSPYQAVNAIGAAPYPPGMAVSPYAYPPYAAAPPQAPAGNEDPDSADELDAESVALCQAVGEDIREYETGAHVVYRVVASDYGVERDECLKCGLKGHFMRGKNRKKCPLRNRPLAPKCPSCGKGGHLPEYCPRAGSGQQARLQDGSAPTGSQPKN